MGHAGFGTWVQVSMFPTCCFWVGGVCWTLMSSPGTPKGGWAVRGLGPCIDSAEAQWRRLIKTAFPGLFVTVSSLPCTWNARPSPLGSRQRCCHLPPHLWGPDLRYKELLFLFPVGEHAPDSLCCRLALR